jgi:hypothetical protein
MESKRKRGRPRKNSEVWYHPNSYEAKKQGEEMYNEIMGEPKYTKFKSDEERKAYTAKVAKEYLDAHPEEVIKLRDEGLVKEMVDFAAKQRGTTPLAITEAPTEEEVYLAKREAEGRPLIISEEAGDFPSSEQIAKLDASNRIDIAAWKKAWKDSPRFIAESEQLDNHFNRMSDEAQDRLVEAIQTVNNALANHPAGSDWDIDKDSYEASKTRIKDAIQKEKDIKKEIKLGGATTYPLKSSAYCVPHSDIKDRPQDWNIEYVGGADPIDENARVNLARVEKDGTVRYLNQKGETVRTFKDGSLVKNEESEEEHEEEHEEVYHESLMEANSRTSLIMLLVVFLVILAYLIWM